MRKRGRRKEGRKEDLYDELALIISIWAKRAKREADSGLEGCERKALEGDEKMRSGDTLRVCQSST